MGAGCTLSLREEGMTPVFVPRGGASVCICGTGTWQSVNQRCSVHLAPESSSSRAHRYESISREIGRKKLESERKKKKKQVGSDMRALPLRAAGKTARRKHVPELLPFQQQKKTLGKRKQTLMGGTDNLLSLFLYTRLSSRYILSCCLLPLSF